MQGHILAIFIRTYHVLNVYLNEKVFGGDYEYSKFNANGDICIG